MVSVRTGNRHESSMGAEVLLVEPAVQDGLHLLQYSRFQFSATISADSPYGHPSKIPLDMLGVC